MQSGPVDPKQVLEVMHLPPNKTLREMAERTWARVRGQVLPKDFDLSFEFILRWLSEHSDIGIEQAKWTAHDLVVQMCGIVPAVFVARCEKTGIVLVTVTVKSGGQRLSRTRSVKITEPADGGTEAAAVSLHIVRTGT